VGETTDEFFGTMNACEVQSFSYTMGEKDDKDEDSPQGDGDGSGAPKPGTNKGVSSGIKVRSGSFQRGKSGGSSSGGSVGGSKGKASLGSVTINKFLDSASTNLAKCCAAGIVIPTLNLSVRKSGGDRLIYLQYCFRANQVKSTAWSGGSGDARPTEALTIEFKAVGMRYYRQTAGGSLINDLVSSDPDRANADVKDRMFDFKWNVTEGEGQEDLTINGEEITDEEAFLDPFADWLDD
jgi:type VI protein secretion system component Hcp